MSGHGLGQVKVWNLQIEPWNNLSADLSQGMANSQMEPWNNLSADLSQGMANSQMEPWNNLWADLSQGMANSQMEPWNNLWADLSQGMANSQMEPWNNLWADLSQGMANSQDKVSWRITQRTKYYVCYDLLFIVFSVTQQQDTPTRASTLKDVLDLYTVYGLGDCPSIVKDDECEDLKLVRYLIMMIMVMIWRWWRDARVVMIFIDLTSSSLFLLTQW